VANQSIAGVKPMKGHSIGVALVAILSCNAAAAELSLPEPSIFSFSGYGTIGLAHSSEHKADFVANDLQYRGAGHSRNWSPDVDSRIGAQVSAQFTPQTSAVVQVTSEQRYDGTYAPAVEWANIKYAATPDFSVRAGRIVLPNFLVSDYRKVGFANVWVRPPVEVYGLVPLTNSDGIDISWRKRFGEVSNTVQLSYGNSSAKIPNDDTASGEVSGKHGIGIFDTIEYGAATLHLSYFQADLTIGPYRPLADGFRNFGSEGNALADKYDTNNKPFSFIGIGGMYDPGKWFVAGEWGIIDTNSVYGKRAAWYTSGGYRVDKFTPYVSYARTSVRSQTSDPGLTLSSYPANARPTAAALNYSLNSVLQGAPVQETISVGVRWDLARNTALKIQYDHSNIINGSPGTLVNVQPGFVTGGTFNVVSITVDFLF